MPILQVSSLLPLPSLIFRLFSFEALRWMNLTVSHLRFICMFLFSDGYIDNLGVQISAWLLQKLAKLQILGDRLVLLELNKVYLVMWKLIYHRRWRKLIDLANWIAFVNDISVLIGSLHWDLSHILDVCLARSERLLVILHFYFLFLF